MTKRRKVRKERAPWWRPGTSEPKKKLTKLIEKAPVEQTPKGPVVKMTPELNKYICQGDK